MPPSMISDKGVGGVSEFQIFKDNGEKGGCGQLISDLLLTRDGKGVWTGLSCIL